jgi:hypothetical protein
MKFKSDIELQAGLRDGSDNVGTAGQLLSSTGTITNWIDQAEVVAAGATRVLIACKNTSGGTITKGTPVYQTGNVGATDVIEIAEADALISTGYLPAIGLLETDLINNAFGHVVITGELLNITTSPIDGVVPTTGDTIYLKSGGGLTLTKPTGEGNAIQNLGLVGKVSGGNAGSITVASIMRQNDVPNLPTGKIWVGDGNTIVSDVVYLDEPNGRMGIGTTSPAKKLDVAGEIQGTNFFAETYRSARTDGDIYIQAATATDFVAIGTQVSANLMRIDGSGNVGIGTTSPTSLLHVKNSTFGTALASFETSGRPLTIGAQYTHVYMGYGNREQLKIAGTSGNGRIIIGTTLTDDGTNTLQVGGTGYFSGNVGIGTTSPGSKLEVQGGDIEVDDSASGLILKSPDGTRYRITLANGGTLTVTAV